MEHWIPFFYNQTDTIFDYLKNPIIILDSSYKDSLKNFLDTVNDHYVSRNEYDNNKLSKTENKYFSLKPNQLYQDKETFLENLSKNHTLEISPFKKPSGINFNGKISNKYFGKESKKYNSDSYQSLKNDIENYLSDNKVIIIACSSSGSEDRIKKILSNYNINTNLLKQDEFDSSNLNSSVYTIILNLNSGFLIEKYAFISEQDILVKNFIGQELLGKLKIS